MCAVVLKTHDSALIFMSYRGVRRPASKEVGRRASRAASPSTAAIIICARRPSSKHRAPAYAWINQIVSVGMGERVGANVAYDLFEIL